jgi:hypothetical protein
LDSASAASAIIIIVFTVFPFWSGGIQFDRLLCRKGRKIFDSSSIISSETHCSAVRKLFGQVVNFRRRDLAQVHAMDPRQPLTPAAGLIIEFCGITRTIFRKAIA